MSEVADILTKAGYTVSLGCNATKTAILRVADTFSQSPKLCSGYGVFPGGEKCTGCTDCRKKG